MSSQQEPPPDNEPEYDWVGEMFAADKAPVEDVAADPRPRDLDAERAVLGSMLLAQNAIETVLPLLSAEDFWRPIHGVVFAAINALFEAGEPTDPVGVAGRLQRDGNLMRVGGSPYLHTLTSEVFTATNVAYYAERVAQCAALARIYDTGQRLMALGTNVNDELAAVQERAREAVEKATATREDTEDGVWVSDVVSDVLAAWEQPDADGLPYPYLDVEDVTRGMRRGQLVIVAARPGQGKSTLAMDCARKAARGGVASLFISLEMSQADLITRMVCAEAGVRFTAVRDRAVTDEDRLKLKRAEHKVQDFPIRIEDRFGMTLGQIRAKARDIARTCNLGLLIVDYLQLIKPADTRVSRREQVDAISRGLKGLAKELQLPILAVAQLNRGPEARQEKVPAMSDLRESGALEQDADVIILVHRPDYYDFESPRSGQADLILAKHRNGPTSTIPVAHQLYFCRLADLQRGA